MICNNCIHKELCNEWEQRTEYIKPVKNGACDHYADATEMVKLPCKVGDTVYWVDETALVELGDENIGTYKIAGIALKSDGFYIIDDDNNVDKIGSEYALLTKGDAERKFAELKGAGE